MALYYGNNGVSCMLDEHPIAKPGGEGSVFAVRGKPDVVAKIYHAPSSEQEEKVLAQISVASPVPNCAWPIEALYKDKARTDFAGFTMQRCSSKASIGDLYKFPGPNIAMGEKLRVLCSLCRVSDEMHKKGQVIGDYNSNNILLTRDYGVLLIDCDSFDVRCKGKRFPCGVCFNGYAAPEAIRAQKGFKNYAAAAKSGREVFTDRTDDFALAVNIFRMLFNGAHPYTGVPAGGVSPTCANSLDKTVEQGLTPYFRNVPSVTIPWFSPDLSAFPSYLTGAFRRAFVDGHTEPSDRPTASEWEQILSRYLRELKKCPNNGAHEYHRDASSCPYCQALLRKPRLPVNNSGGKAQAGNESTTKKQSSSTASPSNEKKGWLDANALAIVGTLLFFLLLFLLCRAPFG